MSTVSTAGDAGDVMCLLGILSELPGGPHRLVFRDNGKTRGIKQHFRRYKKLIEVQPYIKSLELYSDQAIDWASEDFRYMGREPGGTLLESHWAHGRTVLKSNLTIRGEKPWLHVKPDRSFAGKVIIARSPRYRNEFFPWPQVYEFYKDRAVFVGLPEEHAEFSRTYGYLPHATFEDFYDLAAAIAGSDLFIGNQSFPNAINEALKHDSILEVCLEIPDCLYARPNARFCFDGRLQLGDFWTNRTVVDPGLINVEVTPPGGWVFTTGNGNRYSSNTFYNLCHILRNNGELFTRDDVLRQTAQRLSPEFYKQASRHWLPRLRTAFEKAGIPLDVPDMGV